MEDYKDKTKEELIKIIQEQEEKLAALSAKENLLNSGLKPRFREKYSLEILDSFPDMITVFDYDLNCVELVSGSHTNHVEGVADEDISNLNLCDIVPQDAYQIVKANMEEVIRLKEPRTAQHTLFYQGEQHYYENRVCPLGDRHLICVCRDVTRRVKSEIEGNKQQKEIERLNSLMQAILDNVPVYLFVKDVKNDFRYLYWNKEFANKSGISAQQALGKTDFEIFSNAAEREKFRKEDLETLAVGLKQIEEEYTTACGERRTVHTSKLVANAPNGNSYIIGISWDISELKNTERELVAARKQAEESDRLKSAFLANMSHEIRTPLNSIVGFSRLVIEPGHNEEKEEYCRIIEKNSELLLNLFNDILDLSSLEAGTLTLCNEPVSLYPLLQQEYNRYRKKTTAGVQLKLDEADPLLSIVTDKIRLSQILTNLLSNAIKFTAKGEIRFGYQIRENIVLFYVKDSGVGIPANRLATIFQRFGKIDNFAQGTGLGLTISRMLVEQLGGRIWARSTEAKGTTFYFTLPLVNDK